MSTELLCIFYFCVFSNKDEVKDMTDERRSLEWGRGKLSKIIMLVWVLANELVWISTFERISSLESEASLCLHCYAPCRKGAFHSSFCHPSSLLRVPDAATGSPGAGCSEWCVLLLWLLVWLCHDSWFKEAWQSQPYCLLFLLLTASNTAVRLTKCRGHYPEIEE